MRCDDMIRVLGPMDLLTPAGPRSVGSSNNRALLGALVVSAGHAVAVDQLQAAVWGDMPPESVALRTALMVRCWLCRSLTEGTIPLAIAATSSQPCSCSTLSVSRQCSGSMEGW